MQQQGIKESIIRPMQFFTEWDVENASPNCIPRSCCLRLTHLHVYKALEHELKAIVLCLAMQGSRRSLRSDQIPVQSSGVVNEDLELVFTLQYPHYLKRRENHLQIALQRRKKYRNRTILGYKTLAVGYINMAQVLQGWYAPQLHLYAKDKKTPAATVTIASLSSDPLDRDIGENRRSTIVSLPEEQLSSDDESYSSDVEEDDEELQSNRLQTFSRRSAFQRKVRAQNFKQRIIQAVFKKLKVTDDDLGGVEDDDSLFEDDDEEEDSEDENFLVDTTSVSSIQRPGLRPFFDQSQSSASLNTSTLTNEETKELRRLIKERCNEQVVLSSGEPSPSSDSDIPVQQKTAGSKKSARSISLRERSNPKKVELRRKSSLDEVCMTGTGEQVSLVLGADDNIPDFVLLVGVPGDQGQRLALKLMARLRAVIYTPTDSDVQITISAIANKFQKFCNHHSVSPPPLRIVLLGAEDFLCQVVSNFVEKFSAKRQEYQNYVKFLVAPTTACQPIPSHISQLDNKYNLLFMDQFWRSVFEQHFFSETDINEIEDRIRSYVEQTDSVTSIAIAEALITNKKENGESSQIFIPFTTEVKIGSNAEAEVSSDVEMFEKKEYSSSSPSYRGECVSEPLDLNVDYWTVQPNSQARKEEKKEANKLSIKSTFRSLSVRRLGVGDNDGLLLTANLKARNKGVKRIMRAKDSETKNIVSVYVSKVVCTAKSSGQTFSVTIDGRDWNNVKFFSLSSLWPTHIKTFPLGMHLNFQANHELTT